MLKTKSNTICSHIALPWLGMFEGLSGFKSKKQKSSMGYDLCKGKTPNKPIIYIYQYIIMMYTQNTTYCMYIEI